MGSGPQARTVEEKVGALAAAYAAGLREKIGERLEAMKADDKSHFLIYRVLGITVEEGELIDVYQNKGRFLYKYAGSFLEEAAKLCFLEAFPDSKSARIPNTEGKRPRTFEIDCAVERDAVEIKWRDATTDRDHITKEHTRLKVIKDAGYHPIRVMFYYPNRVQARRIQATLEMLYAGAGGEYHHGDGAWDYVERRTGINLRKILERIAERNAPQE